MYTEYESIFHRLRDYGEDGYLPSKEKEGIFNEVRKKEKGLYFETKQVDMSSISKIKRAIYEIKNEGLDISGLMFAVDFNNLDEPYMNAQECSELKNLSNELSSQGAELVIAAEDLFTIDNIIDVNSRLDAEVEYINSLTVPDENNRPLNQMEKFLMAYDFCTNFKYHENKQNLSYSRSITSIMSGQDIVCVGYAKLLQELCFRLGIECFTMGSSVSEKTSKKYLGGHKNNIVVIDGKMYYADACWDSQKQGNKGLKTYTYCLIPVSDKDHINNSYVEYSDGKYSMGYVITHKDEIIATSKEFLRLIKNNEFFDQRALEEFIWILDYSVLVNVEIPPIKEYDIFSGLSFSEQLLESLKEEANFKLAYAIEYLSKFEYGQAIPYEVMENSLYNINRAKGMSTKNARNLTDRTMAHNEERALKKYDSNAQNCFVQGRTQELGM